MVRILTVFGTRPEVVKLAPVIHALKQHASSIETIICSTGQHREMLIPLYELFGIIPDIELDVMRKGQTLEDLTASSDRSKSVTHRLKAIGWDQIVRGLPLMVHWKGLARVSLK